jgi:acyl-CoA dehydrogenase
MLAVIAAQAAGVAAAVDGATPLMRDDAAWIGGALAKARASEAAATVNAAVHQVTAAMGFTREFPLHRFTRRLWAWRDEFGSEQAWHARIGDLVLRRGGAALWPFLVEPDSVTAAA